MKVIDPGHAYELAMLDNTNDDAGQTHAVLQEQELYFVKRVGDKYGTTTQEVIRALIDRTQYVDKQKSHSRNLVVIRSLRQALRELEMRAAEERGEGDAVPTIFKLKAPELAPTCDTCGHVCCSKHREPTDA